MHKDLNRRQFIKTSSASAPYLADGNVGCQQGPDDASASGQIKNTSKQ
jgi:hypothetical protein